MMADDDHELDDHEHEHDDQDDSINDSEDVKARKRKERLEQNRISARESRKRKKSMIEELQRKLVVKICETYASFSNTTSS